MDLHPKIVEKFYQNIDKTNFCWNWTGAVGSSNLPTIYCNVDERHYVKMARRVSVILAGKTLNTSEQVQPLICHNKLCVNPDHLVFGDEARFYSYVSKLSEANGGCWTWMGALNKAMYGVFHMHKNGKLIKIAAHKYSWQLANNHWLQDAVLYICHKCDHPYCVNPDHLFIGTPQENVDDMMSKGRNACGTKIWASKFSEADIRNIRELFQVGGITKAKLALQFGVSRTAIGDIINGQSWKHVV